MEIIITVAVIAALINYNLLTMLYETDLDGEEDAEEEWVLS